MWRSGCVDPRIPDLGISWRWVISFTRRPLYPPGKESPIPIEQEAGWAWEQVWTTWRKEKPCPYQDSNSDPSPPPSRQQVWELWFLLQYKNIKPKEVFKVHVLHWSTLFMKHQLIQVYNNTRGWWTYHPFIQISTLVQKLDWFSLFKMHYQLHTFSEKSN
jgi:hypothetical protein